jgi:hypothetical protein
MLTTPPCRGGHISTNSLAGDSALGGKGSGCSLFPSNELCPMIEEGRRLLLLALPAQRVKRLLLFLRQ